MTNRTVIGFCCSSFSRLGLASQKSRHFKSRDSVTSFQKCSCSSPVRHSRRRSHSASSLRCTCSLLCNDFKALLSNPKPLSSQREVPLKSLRVLQVRSPQNSFSTYIKEPRSPSVNAKISRTFKRLTKQFLKTSSVSPLERPKRLCLSLSTRTMCD